MGDGVGGNQAERAAVTNQGECRRTGLAFDFILVSAVWMHVAPSDRARAFRKLITLLKPGGCLAITLRSGPAEAERRFHPVSAEEIRSLARDHGAFVEREVTDDHFGRGEIRWTQLAVRLPDDGTGALPLLRHVILNDDKSIDQLPADRLLRAAQDRILDWWHAAYRSDPQHPLAERFGRIFVEVGSET